MMAMLLSWKPLLIKLICLFSLFLQGKHFFAEKKRRLDGNVLSDALLVYMCVIIAQIITDVNVLSHPQRFHSGTSI